MFLQISNCLKVFINTFNFKLFYKLHILILKLLPELELTLSVFQL